MNSNIQSEGDAWGELDALTGQVWGEIDQANRSHDTDKLLAATERLRRLNALRQQHHRLRRELEALSSSAETPMAAQSNAPQPAAPTESDPFRDVASAKARGEKARTEWVEMRLKEGYPLTPLRGTLYRNAAGDTVGIAYAMENTRRSGHWFSGLPDGSFQNAVLLCDSPGEGLFSLCLPKAVLDTHHLRTATVAQVKFNVALRNNRTYLRVQKMGLVDVTSFVNSYSAVL